MWWWWWELCDEVTPKQSFHLMAHCVALVTVTTRHAVWLNDGAADLGHSWPSILTLWILKKSCIVRRAIDSISRFVRSSVESADWIPATIPTDYSTLRSSNSRSFGIYTKEDFFSLFMRSQAVEEFIGSWVYVPVLVHAIHLCLWRHCQEIIYEIPFKLIKSFFLPNQSTYMTY
jgi:hypothetical protein